MFNDFGKELFDIYLDTLTSVSSDEDLTPVLSVGLGYNLLLSENNDLQDVNIEDLINHIDCTSLKGGE